MLKTVSKKNIFKHFQKILEIEWALKKSRIFSRSANRVICTVDRFLKTFDQRWDLIRDGICDKIP